ncbi:MAG: glutaredoxin, partial [Chloroflexota bacterium]
MEKLLSDDLVVQIRQLFEKLSNPVHVFLFVSKDKAEPCEPTQQLLEELIPLSGSLSLSVHDMDVEADLAKLYSVQRKAPAIIIAAKDGEQI